MESPSPKSGKRGLTGKHGNHRRGPKVARVSIACEVCGLVREYRPSELRVRKKIRFCSIVCRDSRDRRVAVDCAHCGRSVLKRPDHLAIQKAAYCSAECSHASRRVVGAKWRDPAAIRAYMKAYTERNRERSNEHSRQWSKANRPKKTAASQRYRAVLKGVTVGVVDFAKIIERDGMRCHICRRSVTPATLSFDHVIPLSRGGEHCEANLAVSHRRCNSRKSDRVTRLF